MIDVQAVVLTHNDPVRLNACLWSIFNQSAQPTSILIVNTGGWAVAEVAGAIDIISECIPVSIRRVPNSDLGSVHAAALQAAEAQYVWFFQDDAVAHYGCLKALSAQIGRHNSSVIPTILYPDYEAMPGEADELSQERSTLEDMFDQPKAFYPSRGPCLGILFSTAIARRVADAVIGYPMGIDDIIVKTAVPWLVSGAYVYHTRPEKPRWERIVQLMKTKVLPDIGKS